MVAYHKGKVELVQGDQYQCDSKKSYQTFQLHMSVIFYSALFLGRAAKIVFLNINHRGKTPGNKGFIYFA
jgi:hypothetical protein